MLKQHFTALNHKEFPPAASPELSREHSRGARAGAGLLEQQHLTPGLKVNVERQQAHRGGRRKRKKHGKSEQPRIY